MRRGAGYLKHEEIRLREMANIRFIDWAENLFEQGLEVGAYIVVGDLVPQVIKAAHKEETDLIVVGRSHKGILEQLYEGSEVTELLRRTAIPVVVFKHLTESRLVPEKLFDRLLLATDGSPASLRAVEYLKDLKDVAKKIDVIHVVDGTELKGDSSLDVQKTRKEKRKKLDEICKVFEAEGISAKSHIRVGNPDREIEKAAREYQSTLIVLGSSGKAAWVERWIGSTPKNIAEDSIFPTMLIPPEQV
jgi:nucleotide-binding universal stress UspA family protein